MDAAAAAAVALPVPLGWRRASWALRAREAPPLNGVLVVPLVFFFPAADVAADMADVGGNAEGQIRNGMGCKGGYWKEARQARRAREATSGFAFRARKQR